jgi:GH25 family lysozyme M1 (1,4-beta-N-acetylmuramidase)
VRFSLRAALRRVAPLTTGAVALAMVAGTAVADTGIDVSRWQHGTTLNWSKVAADGVDFAFIKATEGSTYTNAYFAGDWAATGKVGIRHGAYHFARPSKGTAAKQARYFVSVAGLADRAGDLPPVLDLEASGGLNVADLKTWTRNWLETVEELTGRTPIIYCSPSFWEYYLANSTGFTHYPLWIAHYGVTKPRVPGGWSTWTFWQKTSSGRVDGISGNVDINVFNGSTAELDRLANVTVPSTDPGTPTGPTVPAAAATTLSIAVDRSTVYAGGRVTFSGTLTGTEGAPVPAVTVAVKNADGTVARVSTDTEGRYAATLPVGAAGSYWARFPGTAAFAPSRSPRVSVALRAPASTALDLHSDRTRVRPRTKVLLYGHLTSAGSGLAGKSLDFYRRFPGSSRWVRIASGTSLAPTGWYQTYVHPRRKSIYKAVFRGTSRLAAASSGPVRVRMR